MHPCYKKLIPEWKAAYIVREQKNEWLTTKLGSNTDPGVLVSDLDILINHLIVLLPWQCNSETCNVVSKNTTTDKHLRRIYTAGKRNLSDSSKNCLSLIWRINEKKIYSVSFVRHETKHFYQHWWYLSVFCMNSQFSDLQWANRLLVTENVSNSKCDVELVFTIRLLFRNRPHVTYHVFLCHLRCKSLIRVSIQICLRLMAVKLLGLFGFGLRGGGTKTERGKLWRVDPYQNRHYSVSALKNNKYPSILQKIEESHI